jgi:hypothetical protein
MAILVIRVRSSNCNGPVPIDYMIHRDCVDLSNPNDGERVRQVKDETQNAWKFMPDVLKLITRLLKVGKNLMRKVM